MGQAFIEENIGVPHWNGQRQIPLWGGGVNQIYERSISPLNHPYYKYVNKNNPRPIVVSRLCAWASCQDAGTLL